MPALELVLPGDPETLTGGYEYDRRIVAGLSALDWDVRTHALAASFPSPSMADRDGAARAFAALPDDALVLVDGLALGVLPEIAAREQRRLRLVALVHHPLAAESGLAPDERAHLAASERDALACVRRVVVTGTGTARALGEYGVRAERLVVVEPGTDPAPLARGSGGPGLRLLCVATLTPRKGHDLLLAALGALQHRDWRLDCVGSADRSPVTAALLAGQIAALGLSERVCLRGELPAGALREAYLHADVFVLAARHEGYGMAAAEALAHGLPVVGTAVGALPELVGDEAGVLVAPGDLPTLTAALDRMLQDAAFRTRCAQGAARARDRLPRWQDSCARLARALAEVR